MSSVKSNSSSKNDNESLADSLNQIYDFLLENATSEQEKQRLAELFAAFSEYSKSVELRVSTLRTEIEANKVEREQWRVSLDFLASQLHGLRQSLEGKQDDRIMKLSSQVAALNQQNEELLRERVHLQYKHASLKKKFESGFSIHFYYIGKVLLGPFRRRMKE